MSNDCSMEYILVMPAHNLEAYLASVASHPVLTKAATSCVAYGIGEPLVGHEPGGSFMNVVIQMISFD